LGEVVVPAADREHRVGGHQADDLVGLPGEHLDGLRRADRHCHHDPGRTAPPQRTHRGETRQAGREAVVDHDHGSVSHVERRPSVAEALHPAKHLPLLVRQRAVELRLRHLDAPCNGLIHHGGTAFGDRADAQLRVLRRAELADGQHVQLRAEPSGNLDGHGHAPARQREDERVLRSQR
jgi:hypothetical protein